MPGVDGGMLRIAAHTKGHRHADARLLHHLGSLDLALGRPPRPARERLERELGTDLTRLILSGLCTPRRLAA